MWHATITSVRPNELQERQPPDDFHFFLLGGETPKFVNKFSNRKVLQTQTTHRCKLRARLCLDSNVKRCATNNRQ